MPSNPHLPTLEALITLGATLAQDLLHARQNNEITPKDAAEAFERIARATRRTVFLATRLAEPEPRPGTHPQAPEPDPATRRTLIRAVEDAISREPDTTVPERHALESEFHERLDAPELAEDLAHRPVEAVITDILRDLDLGRSPFLPTPTWRRRTPAAIRRLHARAAGQPLPPEPEPPPPRALPEPDRATLLALHSHLMGHPTIPPPRPGAPDG